MFVLPNLRPTGFHNGRYHYIIPNYYSGPRILLIRLNSFRINIFSIFIAFFRLVEVKKNCFAKVFKFGIRWFAIKEELPCRCFLAMLCYCRLHIHHDHPCDPQVKGS